MKGNQKILVIIAGPTAVGKTSLAIKLALHYNAEIFSADSRQIYHEMTIGTAKPTNEELSSVKHHMINVSSVTNPIDVFEFEKTIIKKLDAYFNDHNIAFLVGGTGLYIRAILNGLDEFPEIKEGVLKDLEDSLESHGIKLLQSELEDLDPEYYAKVDLYNSRRLIRALSVIKSSGKTYSSFLNESPKKRSFKPIKLKLNIERSLLYDRINKRVDQMILDGLEEECKALVPYKSERALQTIGYKELFEVLEGRNDLESAISKIKQHSRNYAKRQITWFNNSFNAQEFNPEKIKDIISYIDRNR